MEDRADGIQEVEAEDARKEVRLYFTIGTFAAGWQAIARELSDATVLSGLVDRCSSVFVNAVGGENLDEFFPGNPKVTLEVHPDRDTCEFPALERMLADAKASPSFLAMYCHSKGLVSGAHEHRKCLIGHTIWRWRECVRLLESCEACGVRPIMVPYFHFPGNFWWVRADYVQRLCSPREAPDGGKASRFRAEGWICSGSPAVESLYVAKVANFYHWGMPKALFTW